MKKFLSLVLALVMTMSLVTISAGAKNFTDDSKITYKDAVAVMSDIGVIDGYTGGGFQPTTTLTRGAAAKIICNMILGPTTAGALSADAAPFKDVPATHTFAGYIAYCAQQGIINGYADGTFRPAGTLNGYAFMKMLLGALGYDSKLEGYTGANWSIAVAKQALAIGLADGNDEFFGANAVTREEAMLYGFNTLDTDMVQYKDKGSSITVGGVEIVNPASSNEKVPQSGYKGNMSNDAVLQFAEKYFKDLKKDSTGSDAFGRPAAEWSFKGDVSATVTEAADVTYTKAVKYKDLYKDANVKTGANTFDYFVDGETKADLTIGKTVDTKIGGNGVLLEVFYDQTEDEEVAIIVAINTQFGEIDDVDENDDDERIVKIGNREYVTEEFEEDDKVIYTEDLDGEDEDAIQTMATPETITGTLTKMTGDSEFVVDGKTYKLNKNGDVASDVDVKDDVTVYFDAYGYVIYMEEADDNTSIENMAYVLDGGNVRGAWAKLLFTDGKTKMVDLENKDGATFKGTIVSFKDNDGTYKLSDRSGKFDTADLNADKVGKVEFKKGKTKVTIGEEVVTTNSKTVFVYALTNGDDVTYKVYTGYKAAPSVEATIGKAAAYVKSGNTASLVVFEVGSDAITTSSNLTFVVANKSGKIVDDGDDTYYEFAAVVDGAITTIKVNTVTGGTIKAGADDNKVVFVYKTVNYDSSDIMKATSTPAVMGEAETDDYVLATESKKESNDVITLDGKGMPYASDVKVFFADDAKLTAGDISDIRDDNDGAKDPYANIYYTVNSDGEVETVILVKQ